MSKTSFSSKKNNRFIFVLIIALFLLVLIKGGDSYYNRFTSWLSDKTNETIILPKIKEIPFRLGLDLQGGAQLVYQADVSQVSDSDKDDLLEGVREVIERRVNAFGVSEPVIQINKTIDNDYRVIVELAGVKSVDEAIKEIGETPRLEFKEQDLSSASVTEDNLKLMTEYNEELKARIEEIYNKVKAGEDFSDLAKVNNAPKALSSGSDSIGTENDGDLGWIDAESNSYVYNLVKDLSVGQSTEIIETDLDYTILKLEDKKTEAGILSEQNNINQEKYKVREIFLEKMTKEDLLGLTENWKNTELTGKNLSRAVIQFNPNDNRPEVSLEFDSEGAELFAEITERNVGKPVAIYLDDYPISVPNVNEKISGGKAVISGNFSITEAKELVQRLKAGALPVPIELINQKTVGASLGHQSIIDSLEAGIIGLILVALFMLIIYRLFGLTSVFSLLIYGAIVLAIFKALPVAIAVIIGLFFVGLMLITFDELKLLDISLTLLFVVIGIILLVYGINAVTLTLAGVAGFILSIGMAVDANVLIFERIKEELKTGRTIKDAVDEGIRRAWPSIRDGNVSTLLICLVLMSFGTGVLKGFGTTLFIGVSASMFSAIVITRSFLNLFLGKKMENSRLLLGVKRRKENIN
ncbi:MAG: peptidylprolyl isomerase [Patescibacteria group bacterium]|nr:peptidylprolyl isomerase [Patescibacteria group bacterium]